MNCNLHRFQAPKSTPSVLREDEHWNFAETQIYQLDCAWILYWQLMTFNCTFLWMLSNSFGWSRSIQRLACQCIPGTTRYWPASLLANLEHQFLIRRPWMNACTNHWVEEAWLLHYTPDDPHLFKGISYPRTHTGSILHQLPIILAGIHKKETDKIWVIHACTRDWSMNESRNKPTIYIDR